MVASDRDTTEQGLCRRLTAEKKRVSQKKKKELNGPQVHNRVSSSTLSASPISPNVYAAPCIKATREENKKSHHRFGPSKVVHWWRDRGMIGSRNVGAESSCTSCPRVYIPGSTALRLEVWITPYGRGQENQDRCMWAWRPKCSLRLLRTLYSPVLQLSDYTFTPNLWIDHIHASSRKRVRVNRNHYGVDSGVLLLEMSFLSKKQFKSENGTEYTHHSYR